ncbi:ribose 5-phosphate isomerase A-domain-containing protein [Phycomyces nitens]|nr:ribose 5-phosphate isomerase A-domain-containing protein [Phycomyces nitens]
MNVLLQPYTLPSPASPSNILYSRPSPSEPVTPRKKRPSKAQVPVACVNCKKAHLACDLSRPCKRCVCVGKSDTCHDIQPKKRGRPKLGERREGPTKQRPLSTRSNLIFLTMDMCCARASDESLELLGIYPQEFSHRPLYDFVLPEYSSKISSAHRRLLDNATQLYQKYKTEPNTSLPPTRRTTSASFTETLPSTLLGIANGSQTLKETLVFKCAHRPNETFEACFYLGGGLGADLFDPTSVENLYVVCLMTQKPTSSLEPDGRSLENTKSPFSQLDSLPETDPVPSQSILQNRNHSIGSIPTTSETSILLDHELGPSLPSMAQQQQQQQHQHHHSQMAFMHSNPNEYYYTQMTSSRLSAEARAIANHSLPLSNPVSIEVGKKQAAYQAVDDHINAECKVVGIGSGSTVVYAVERILQRPELKDIVYVPTSFQSKLLIVEGGLTMGSIEQFPDIDVTIDGADEVDGQLNVIKGGGACQFQEKLVAEAARKFVIIADYRKKSKQLGTEWTKGVPVEVVPMAYKSVMTSIETKLSQKPLKSTLRMAVNKAGPVVTDNGNFVVDAHFGAIEDPAQLLREIKLLTGVYEVGLFCGMAEIAYFGEADGSVCTL